MEKYPLRHHGILGRDKHFERVSGAGAVLAGSKTLGSAITRHLLESKCRTLCWLLQWQWVLFRITRFCLFVLVNGLLILSIAVAVLCDWTLASLPIVFMWNLQMSTKLKAGICLLMSMGFL